jgi:hypothetical protein
MTYFIIILLRYKSFILRTKQHVFLRPYIHQIFTGFHSLIGLHLNADAKFEIMTGSWFRVVK